MFSKMQQAVCYTTELQIFTSDHFLLTRDKLYA